MIRPSSQDPQTAGSSLDTSVLIGAAKAGDHRAWVEVDDRYRRRLALLVRGKIPTMLRRRFDTDDVIQSAMIQAYRELDSFEDDGSGSFHRWISRIVQNRFYSKIRFHRARLRDSRSEVQHNDVGEVTDTEESLWVEPSDLESAEAIARVLDRLSDQPEEVSLLIQRRFFDERTFDQLAEEFGTSEATIRRRVAAALLKLRFAL